MNLSLLRDHPLGHRSSRNSLLKITNQVRKSEESMMKVFMLVGITMILVVSLCVVMTGLDFLYQAI